MTSSSAASAVVDDFALIASGAIFSSQANNLTEQFDVRRVTRVYAFRSRTGGWPFGYSRFARLGLNNTSFRPDRVMNSNSPEIEISADTSESFEPNSKDCLINMWQENTPGNTTDVYFCRSQRWPTQVLTEDVALTVPGDRWQTTLLKYGILKDVEYTEYGRDDNPQEKYDKALREFLAWARSGVDTTNRQQTRPKEV